MPGKEDRKTITFRVKNLTCEPAVRLIRDKLSETGFQVDEVSYGRISLGNCTAPHSREMLKAILNRYAMDLIIDREEQIVEDIKTAVHELIHDLNNMNSVIRRSDFIVEKLGYSYTYLSKLFSKVEKTTLEKYIIQKKIERIRELIGQNEYTLSEIAHMMGYSSVQYLSNQFREITGESPSEYKQRFTSA